jgi:DNA-binding MarR family transcriptional regulator
MTLDQKHLDILQAIQKGCRSDIEVSEHLDIDIPLVGYYLEEMKQHGYVDFENFVNFGGSQKLVSLTNKGIVALNHPDKL